jgi:type IV pilus assembly protein PilN
MNSPQNSSTRDRSQFLNDLFQRKAFSWTKAFEDLERVMPPRLHVSSIHPELSPDNELEIKLVVDGDTREHALDLVSKMEASKHFHDTYIEEENSNPGNASAGDAVQFHITAVYVPEIGSSTAGGAQ